MNAIDFISFSVRSVLNTSASARVSTCPTFKKITVWTALEEVASRSKRSLNYAGSKRLR